MKFLATFCLLLFLFSLSAQQRIDGAFAFQSDPAKKYSIYVPSSYDVATANKLMLGLHPLNTNRWDAEAWCDTLIVFAETNGLLLICPDGGADGAIDDPIDTAFSTVLLDSMALWYNVDAAKRYIMGFSWGGKTTYTYGLRNADKFAGFMPIGSAMSGTAEINAVLQNAKDKPFFLVHGGNDSPSARFYQVRGALAAFNACLADTLMSGVGHTIDFPNRNAILTTAFHWIENNSCSTSGFLDTKPLEGMTVYPTILDKNSVTDIYLDVTKNMKSAAEIRLMDLQGRVVFYTKKALGLGQNGVQVSLETVATGMYILQVVHEGKSASWKLSIR